MSSLVLLRRGDYRVMPWRNGLGTTTEIAIHPPGAALDEFLWRVSIAEIGSSGPFSTFAGYDRILLQIEGAPLRLSHDGGPERRLELLAPYRFAGELATTCAVDAPPARDFNVMVRRDRASAEVSVHELAEGASVPAEASLIHVLRGSVSVEAGGRDARAVAGDTVVSSATTHVIRAGAGGALAVLVSIGAPRLAASRLTCGPARSAS